MSTKTNTPQKTMADNTMQNKLSTKSSPLPVDLTVLMEQIDQLPEEHREQIKPTLTRVVEYTKRRRRILNLIQEALSQLRLDMKYLMFDVEATRRERDAYKAALEEE